MIKKETMIDPTDLPDIFIIFYMSIHIIYYQIILNKSKINEIKPYFTQTRAPEASQHLSMHTL